MFTNTKTNGEHLHNFKSLFPVLSSFSYSGYDVCVCAFTAAGMSPLEIFCGRHFSNDNLVFVCFF